ncbi:mitochondrial carrier [Dendrothele bispora CBS 962.96]|uniref:Mitochondrial carrier n=1 Tax=Dendrothele bispora (strain CBS 962.96) TaxID=1314807 RepID=A0A4S8M8Y4_DENBC|nr:mitochondrial carrier [Dendrothele bispora CBS 962.96]
MASDPPKVIVQSPSSGSEREPLLANDADRTYNGQVPVAEAESDAESQQEAAPKKRISWLTVFFWVVGIIAVVFFIKGFIEAGDVDFDLKKALKSALGGGLSGAAAMVLQVLTLMPLRTVMNYQYRYGTTTSQAIRTLYHEGGYRRYYQGLLAALIQGPVSRFGDTAANAGILAFLASNTYMKDLPVPVKTIFASLAAAAFRMILTPIDTVKTTMQTQGAQGMAILKTRIKLYGIGTMWYGALATAAATFVGHYPWFVTYNTLQDSIPVPDSTIEKLLRQAFIGFVASVISDTVSNSLRVLKTYRQVNETKIGYLDAAKAVVRNDGLKGLFGRGLKTRIIANGLQGLMFSVLWKLFMDLWDKKTN